MTAPITTPPTAPAPESKPKAKRPVAKKKPAAKPKATVKKSSVKVINDGFTQRSARPAIIGKTLKSRMVRVDAEFADWMREEAKRAGVSITEVSRSVFQSIT